MNSRRMFPTIPALWAFLAPFTPGSDFPVYWTGPQDQGFRAPAGDVDGDGMADLVLESKGVIFSPTSPQSAFVRSGMNGSLLRMWIPSVPSLYGFQGGIVKPAGDLNLDGFGDVALSIMSPVLPLTAMVEVRSGLDASVMALIPPPAISNALIIGSTISGVGDLDGDGWPELLIRGDHQVPGCAIGHGVYDFEAPGFSVQYYQATWQCSQEFGARVGGLDDVDGDGLPDFYVGAPGTDVGSVANAGWIGVFSGVTGSLISSLTGTTANEGLGWDIAPLRDLTGDGNPELAVRRGGLLNQVTVLSLPTFAIVYAVTASSMAGPGGAIMGVDTLGDSDGDGLDDFLVRWRTAGGMVVPPPFSEGITAFSGPTGTPIGQVAQNLPAGVLYPWGGLGDVNGDGLGDFAASPGAAALNLPPFAAQGLWSPWSWPVSDGAVRVYVSPNLRIVGTPTVGGTLQLQVVVPKHPGRPFQVVFAQDYAQPALPLGPFLFPLVPDAVFWATFAANVSGSLNANGQGTLTVQIPNDPSLHGAWFNVSGVIYEPNGPLGIGCVLTHAGFQIP